MRIGKYRAGKNSRGVAFLLSFFLSFSFCFSFPVKKCSCFSYTRRLHTELVKCGSDVEYLAKVHCLREAFSKLFASPAAAVWITDMGRQLISDLIVYADRVRITLLFFSSNNQVHFDIHIVNLLILSCLSFRIRKII